MQMGDGDDENARRLDAVEEAVGKPSEEGPPGSMAERATAVRELEDPFVRPRSRGEGIHTQVLDVALEVLRGRDELGFRASG